VGRLVNLVSPDTLVAFKRGMDAYNAAISAGDVPGLRAMVDKMKAALAFMDAEASAAGHQPLDPLVWEWPLADGRVLCVVRTTHEAFPVTAEQQAGRNLVVYTLGEIARLLAAQESVNAVKLEFLFAVVLTLLACAVVAVIWGWVMDL
jgi:hypothetical protein